MKTDWPRTDDTDDNSYLWSLDTGIGLCQQIDQYAWSCLLVSLLHLFDGCNNLKPVVIEKPREIMGGYGKWGCVTMNWD